LSVGVCDAESTITTSSAAFRGSNASPVFWIAGLQVDARTPGGVT